MVNLFTLHSYVFLNHSKFRFFDKSSEVNENLGVSPSLSVGGRAIRHSLHSVTFKQHLLSLTQETNNREAEKRTITGFVKEPINVHSSRRYFFFRRTKFNANNGLFKENLVKYNGKRTSQDVAFIVFSSLR